MFGNKINFHSIKKDNNLNGFKWFEIDDLFFDKINQLN